MRAVLRCGLLLVAALVSACAALPPRSVEVLPLPTNSWPERRAWLQQYDQFAVTGRVAVAAGGQGFSGSLRFGQMGELSELAIDGPLGIGGIRMRWNGEQLDVVTSRGDHLDGDAARAEMERRLGFVLPLASLRYWLLGVPAPGSPAEETVGEATRLVGMQQDEWALQYSAYAAAPPLPSKLTAQREGARVRIIIDRWMP
ncbi:MAG: lipoprotein insertase outer membrane protein LolB [Steroidobacteraceae bacterium]